MKGRWAAGIVPRNFAWILKGQLAVSERPGGYAPHHRRIRRQEEILWLTGQGFTRVVSLLASGHNLHAYEELGLPSSHFPLSAQSDVHAVLADCYPALLDWLRNGEVVLVHQEELGERVAGVVAGFVCWSGILPQPPQAISAVEQLLKRQMGSAGRSIVAAAADLPGPSPAAHQPAGPLPEHRELPAPVPEVPPVPEAPPAAPPVEAAPAAPTPAPARAKARPPAKVAKVTPLAKAPAAGGESPPPPRRPHRAKAAAAPAAPAAAQGGKLPKATGEGRPGAAKAPAKKAPARPATAGATAAGHRGAKGR